MLLLPLLLAAVGAVVAARASSRLLPAIAGALLLPAVAGLNLLLVPAHQHRRGR
jgi:hypothetical protein